MIEMHAFQQAFLAHLGLYEVVGGVLAVAAICFLLFLLLGPARPYRGPR